MRLLSFSMFPFLLWIGSVQADEHKAAEPATAAEIYGQGVRDTSARTPEDERRGFHLPDGFEVQLFASEPQIAKPLNMAWDVRGRLWITNTIEYPYPAKGPEAPRDSIKILEDTDGDGQADKVSTFADQLNIPMGLLPVADGVICFNIPDIVLLRDTDGDDRCDERVKILGPFDTTRDTHGMINAMRRGADGWIYACHGFNNQSQVTARDGSSVKLISGNTFRFREDGSRIEVFTTGQVNPFGMTSDEWGNRYTADCHSKPITALLPGGCYPSFGRKHDGLGFAPSMMDHLHGSTAICGLLYYQAEHFPTQFRNRFYSGNVMTSRINCNAITRDGARVVARELPDFMTSDDPWFRPVDILLGPDGALYVADFYNKIIGHYEVPLEHPERDRLSGRIWRITYRGTSAHEPAGSLADYAKQASQRSNLEVLDEKELSSINPTRRELAIDRLVQRSTSPDVLAQVRKRFSDPVSSDPLRLSCMAVLWQRDELTTQDLEHLLVAASPRLQVEALRAIRSGRDGGLLSLATRAMSNDEPQVRLAAIEAIGRIGTVDSCRSLLELGAANSKADVTTRQACRIAVRSLLRDADALEKAVGSWRLAGTKLPTAELPVDSKLADELAWVLPGLDSPLAAEALLSYVLNRPSVDHETLQTAMASAAKYVTPETGTALVTLVRKIYGDDVLEQAKALDSLCSAVAASDRAYPPVLQDFVIEVAQKLSQTSLIQLESSVKQIDWRDHSGGEWGQEKRKRNDQSPMQAISSLTRGEAYVGTLSSDAFPCPPELAFWLCGHNGQPEKEDSRKNRVQLIDTLTGKVLSSEFPPRHDVAQQVVWKLADHVGRPVKLEVVDGDNGSAFAWIAVGQFSYEGLNPSTVNDRLLALNSLLKYRVASAVSDQVMPLLQSTKISARLQYQMLAAVAQSRGLPIIQALAEQATEMGQSERVSSTELLSQDAQSSAKAIDQLTLQLCLAATARQQGSMAGRLIRSSEGSALLVRLVQQGKLNIAALRGKASLLTKANPSNEIEQLREMIQAADALPDQEKKVVQERLAKVDVSNASAEQGRLLFEKNCIACHQLGGKGTLVGPQLDGVGKRGVARLCEDILDPHRNVDTAFRMSVLLMDDGRVVTGLVREQADGGLLVFGQDGKATPVASSAVAERRDSTKSVMPENIAEVLSDVELSALLKFLTHSP